jgi:hypothetical protein
VTRSQALLGWLDDRSDWLSPLVVKEVRQVVRAREFNLSFGACLVAGLAIAFYGASISLTGDGSTGGWTFVALMTCLAFLGLAVVPLGAFNALRRERAEQTLELITLTALSPRRIVVGKLLAQGVKLATLFAAMAPFIAMSFLLGGIDFVTILIALAVLFLWSLWISAGCVFLSTLFTSRAMSGLLAGAVGLLVLPTVVMGQNLLVSASRGAFTFGFAGRGSYWALAIMATFWLTTIVNLVLLAENRLSLPSDDRVTRLRVGFLVQFLLIAAWTLAYINEPRVRAMAPDLLGIVGGGHLAIVAMFTVTEDLALSRQMARRLAARSSWRWLFAIFRAGGGWGAAYVLVQLAILMLASWPFGPSAADLRWLLAVCGYLCFFTGVPTVLWRLLVPARASALKLRLTVFVLVAVSTVLPDIVHYAVMRPDALDLSFAWRHLFNPLRTLANWGIVESNHWLGVPTAIGLIGLVAYGVLIRKSLTARPAPGDADRPAAAAGGLDRAGAID